MTLHLLTDCYLTILVSVSNESLISNYTFSTRASVYLHKIASRLLLVLK